VCSHHEHQEKGRGSLSPTAGRVDGGGMSLRVSRTFLRTSGFSEGEWARRDRKEGYFKNHRPAHASEAGDLHNRERSGRPSLTHTRAKRAAFWTAS